MLPPFPTLNTLVEVSMKKLLFSVIVAGFVSSAFAGGYQQHNHVPHKPNYNHGQHNHYQHNRHHNHYYYGPRYNRDWVAPVITGLAIGAIIGGASVAYDPVVYVEPVRPIPVQPSSAPQRLINGVVHELRYVYYADCNCNRATWVPIYPAY